MTESVHLEPIVYTIRFYSEGNTFEQRDPFDGVLTLQVFGDVAFIQGFHGTASKEQYILMFQELLDRGIRYIHSERHGKKREYIIEEYLKKLLKKNE